QTTRKKAVAELHNPPIRKAPLVAKAVHHSVIERDENVAGKNAVPEPIAQKGTFHAGVAHEIRGCLIHFLRCNSRANQVAHPIEDITRRAACLPHLFDLPRILYRNHFAVLSSINREVSPKTASRSRLPSIRYRVDSFL